MNHGVSSSLLEKLKSEIGEFYKLPLEDKMKYKVRPGSVEGYGLSLLKSQDQKLDWGDRFYMITNPSHRRNQHLLPEFPPSLRFSLSLLHLPPHYDHYHHLLLLLIFLISGIPLNPTYRSCKNFR